jgi:hypothetical protein
MSQPENGRRGAEKASRVTWIQRLLKLGGRAAWQRILQSPHSREIQRQHRLANPVVTVARLLSGSPADDEEVAGRMRRRVKDPEAVQLALHELQPRRTDFLDDRAYRILEAVGTGQPVAPVDPAFEENFRAQERLARLPLKEAYASLADLAPGLRLLEARVADGRWRADARDPDLGLDAYVDQRLDDVLKSSDSSGIGVVGSVVARTIATMYLTIISGEQAVGDVDSPLLGGDEVPI